ncbi:MAG TPA: hypothetical protein VF021_02020 [Longimicrobiales bacterium]
MSRKIFLLSPASTTGRRAQLLFNEQAQFALAVALRNGHGATLGEVFAFLSGLYFRGKLAYARAFARPLRALTPILVITPDRGLMAPETRITLEDLRSFAGSPIDANNSQYRDALLRDARALAETAGRQVDVVLLGSVASGKYVDILLSIFGERLLFPAEFVGRGDMSRGGLMLRCVDNVTELTYVPVQGAIRHGKRPPRLDPR